MRRLVRVTLFACCLLLFPSLGMWMHNELKGSAVAAFTCNESQYDLTFFSPGEAKVIELVALTSGLLQLSFTDRGNPAEVWRVALHELGKKGVSLSGEYSSFFTERLSKAIKGGRTYKVIVMNEESSSESFPALMSLCIMGDVLIGPL